MQSIVKVLRDWLTGNDQKNSFSVARPEDKQVVAPEAFVLPLPNAAREDIRIPASINGRDLSTGRL